MTQGGSGKSAIVVGVALREAAFPWELGLWM